ncbi:MAG: monooxygenase [Pseudonocardiaceae bacterium]|nr:monooxygenase [Pseudonocardiaceae bacterium]
MRVLKPTRATVVGGSIGGLTAALLLHDLGCDVEVYERSGSALDARGAGIAVLDATVRYFVDRGITDPAEICSSTQSIRYLWPDGSVRYEAGHHYRFSSWNTIYRALLACFDDDRYHLGREMVSFRTRGDEVEVGFADGDTRRCDLLVCADGINSLGRESLYPGTSPVYSGYVAYRGTVPERDLSPATFAGLRDAITYQVIPDSHILVYPIPGPDGEVEPGHRLMNFVWYRNVADGAPLDRLLAGRDGTPRRVSLPPGAMADEAIDEMRALADRALAPPIAEVVTTVAEPFAQAVFDIEVPGMAADQVAILGDAAFAVRPHAAAGTAKAADDAWQLAEQLAAWSHDVPEALRSWEQTQLALGRDLLQRCRDIGERSQFRNSWDPGDPALIFGLYGPGN